VPDPAKKLKTRLALGVPLMLLASLANTGMSACMKLLTRDLGTVGIVFWRNLLCLFFTLPLVYFANSSIPLRDKLRVGNWKHLVIRILSGLLALFLLVYSLKTLSIGTTALLINTYPILIPIVASLWLGVKMIHKLWWGIGLGFLGVAIVLNPQTGTFQWSMLTAMGASLLSAIAYLSLRMSHYSDPAYRTLFYIFLFSTLITGTWSLFLWDENWAALQFEMWPYLLGAGISGFIFQFCMTMASKFGPMRVLSPFAYSTVVFSMIVDRWEWNIPLTATMVIGSVLIFCGGFLTTYLYPKERQ